MEYLDIVKMAKDEIEKAINAQNNILGKALDTKEYQFSQMGRAAGLLELAIQIGSTDETELQENTEIVENE